MKSLLVILLSAIFVDNFVLSKFMGICPFLGVSKKLDSAAGMGAAVTFVMVCATLCTYPIYMFVLMPMGLEYLKTIAFILIIALFVQLVEMVLKKKVPSLYSALGVFLPLITTNCAVLGVTKIVIGDMSDFVGVASLNMGWAILYALFAGIGFTLVMIIMSGIREKLNYYKTPKALAGFPIAMVTASFICMAFYVFSLIV